MVLGVVAGCAVEADPAATAGDGDDASDRAWPGPIPWIPSAATASAAGGEHAQAAAPGVTYFQIYAVGSTFYNGWQYVGASWTNTGFDHGGAQLRVAVLQFGYGTTGATLDGAIGPMYLSENLCGSLSTLHYCAAGELITGFLRYFNFDGRQGGNLFGFVDSIGVPFGRSTDAILIQ
jgi:hypothetical protein